MRPRAPGRRRRGESTTSTEVTGSPDLLKVRRPVDLPALAAVGREGLLPMAAGRREVVPGKAHLDRLSAQGVVGIEGPDAVLEMPLHRRVDVGMRGAARGP